MSTPDLVLAATATDGGFPCWARAGTGVVLAAIAWVGYLGGRSAVRQHRDGRVRAANITGGLVVVGVLAAVAAFWIALTAVF